MLQHAVGVRGKRLLDRVGPRRPPGRLAASGAGSPSLAERGPGLVEPAAPEVGGRRRPRLPVAGSPLGPRLGAEREQLGEVSHRRDVALRGDADEPVREERVAEQERDVGIGRREEPRAPVVEEVALVDRLEPERQPGSGTSGEKTGSALTLARGEQRRAPERALGRPPRRRSRRRARLAHASKNARTAATVASTSASPCAVETNRHSNWDGGR